MSHLYKYKHNDFTFVICEEQTRVFNKALKSKELPLCNESNRSIRHITESEFKSNVRRQPQKDKKEIYVPLDYKTEDFLELLEQVNPIAYLERRKKAITTEVKKQIKDLVASQLKAINSRNISRHNLGNDLIESDLDMILCVTEECEPEYIDGIEEKQVRVVRIVEDITKKENPTALEEEILELALQSRLYTEKIQRKRELVSEFNKAFSGLVLKEDIKQVRETLTESSAYEDAKEKLTAAMKARRAKSAEKKVEKIKSRVIKVAKDCVKHITDDDDMEELRHVLNKVLKPKSKKKASSKAKKKTVTDEAELEEVTPLINPNADTDAEKVIEDVDQTIVENQKELNKAISLNDKPLSNKEKETVGVGV